MLKHEIKVELPNTESLKSIIEKSYFDNSNGKINGNNNYILIDESKDDIAYTIFNGLNGSTVKIINDEIIDGSMRFMIDETHNEIRLYPISIYCIPENDKYIFY